MLTQRWINKKDKFWLGKPEVTILLTLYERGGSATLKSLLEEISSSIIYTALRSLIPLGLVKVVKNEYKVITLTKKGHFVAERLSEIKSVIT